MKSFSSPFSALALRCSLSLAALVAVVALGACGGDGGSDEDRKLSELDDEQAIDACKEVRAEIGPEGAAGMLRYACVSASTIGGTCNANIFENCISVTTPGCTAYPAGSPERTCQATVAEARACGVAFGTQHAAYKDSSCQTPPTSMPKKQGELAACATLCAKCPGMCS
jgi:hypothetical protein